MQEAAEERAGEQRVLSSVFWLLLSPLAARGPAGRGVGHALGQRVLSGRLLAVCDSTTQVVVLMMGEKHMGSHIGRSTYC